MSLFDSYSVVQEIESLLKVYPSFVKLIRFKKHIFINRFDFYPYRPKREKLAISVDLSDEYQQKNLARAKMTVVDICLCNNFSLFVTFTFAKDRFDVDSKKKQMATWLKNQKALYGDFKYIIIPEYHKDKKAIHFHALFSGFNGVLVNSKVKQNNRTIYNIKSYRSGFTTAVKIDNIEKVAGYVSKYLTKDMPKFNGKQRYWCSNGLIRPLKVVNPLLSQTDLDNFVSLYSNDSVEIFTYQGQFDDNVLARIANFGLKGYNDLFVTDL